MSGFENTKIPLTHSIAYGIIEVSKGLNVAGNGSSSIFDDGRLTASHCVGSG